MSADPRRTAAEIAAAWRPLSDVETARDLRRFSAAVRRRYGSRIRGVFLFGSRARGDHSPESDADVAVVFDGCIDEPELRQQLVSIAYDVLLEGGAVIQPFAVMETEWLDPDLQHNQFLGRAMVRDAVALP